MYIIKPAGSLPHPAARLTEVGISPNNEFDTGPIRVRVYRARFKPLMIAANLTLGEVLWLLFELVLIVLTIETIKQLLLI